MINIFGSNYSEVGSLSENFVINTAGKVKIRFGSKFIDILDDRGNLNVPIPKVITKVTSLEDATQNGFFLIDKTLYLKYGKETIQLTKDDETGYVEYSNEQQLSDEEIKTVQRNIGLSLKSLNNIPIDEGIVFVGNTIYKVNSGKAKEYLQQPLKSINELNNNPTYDNVAIVWKNAQWKFLPIVTKEYLEEYTRQFNEIINKIREEIKVKNKTVLFDKVQYSGSIYTISKFDLNIQKDMTVQVSSDQSRPKKLIDGTLSTIPALDIPISDIFVVNVEAFKITPNPSDPNNPNAESIIYQFYLKHKGDGNVAFMDKTLTNEIQFDITKVENNGNYIEFEDNGDTIGLNGLDTLFLNKNIFLKSETEIPNKFTLDYQNSQIAFEETVEENGEKKIVPHIVMGDLDDTEKKYNDPAKPFRTRRGADDKQFKTGLYCDQPVFNGAEFRGKWPTEDINMYDTSADYRQDYPRYSAALNDNICLMLPSFKYDPSKDTFPAAFKNVIPSMEWVYRYALPIGSIIMYNGSTIPRGWHLCDGNAGTPDLRNKFIVGAGTDYTINTSGGQKEFTIQESNLPRHRHTVSDYYRNTSSTTITEAEEGTSKSITIPASSTTYSTRNTSYYGSTNPTAIDNRPPYYVLYFIMKIAL